MIGEPLPRQSIAWGWVLLLGLLAAYLFDMSMDDRISWWIPLVIGAWALLHVFVPFLRKVEIENTELGNDGITQLIDGSRKTIRWSDMAEIAILTTSDGPFAEDLFYVFTISENDGCVVTHESAERLGLLQELQTRFPDLDDKVLMSAMGSTSENRFVIWEK